MQYCSIIFCSVLNLLLKFQSPHLDLVLMASSPIDEYFSDAATDIRPGSTKVELCDVSHLSFDYSRMPKCVGDRSPPLQVQRSQYLQYCHNVQHQAHRKVNNQEANALAFHLAQHNREVSMAHRIGALLGAAIAIRRTRRIWAPSWPRPCYRNLSILELPRWNVFDPTSLTRAAMRLLAFYQIGQPLAALLFAPAFVLANEVSRVPRDPQLQRLRDSVKSLGHYGVAAPWAPKPCTRRVDHLPLMHDRPHIFIRGANPNQAFSQVADLEIYYNLLPKQFLVSKTSFKKLALETCGDYQRRHKRFLTNMEANTLAWHAAHVCKDQQTAAIVAMLGYAYGTAGNFQIWSHVREGHTISDLRGFLSLLLAPDPRSPRGSVRAFVRPIGYALVGLFATQVLFVFPRVVGRAMANPLPSSVRGSGGLKLTDSYCMPYG